jgi:carbon-monoxide dehydrogenase large subunit
MFALILDKREKLGARRAAKSVFEELMNFQNHPNHWTTGKFGIGQPVPRGEDPNLPRGEGRFTEDINAPGQAYAVVVRSRHAHGVIRGIDISAARALLGVLVFTGAGLDPLRRPRG